MSLKTMNLYLEYLHFQEGWVQANDPQPQKIK